MTRRRRAPTGMTVTDAIKWAKRVRSRMEPARLFVSLSDPATGNFGQVEFREGLWYGRPAPMPYGKPTRQADIIKAMRKYGGWIEVTIGGIYAFGPAGQILFLKVSEGRAVETLSRHVEETRRRLWRDRLLPSFMLPPSRTRGRSKR